MAAKVIPFRLKENGGESSSMVEARRIAAGFLSAMLCLGAFTVALKTSPTGLDLRFGISATGALIAVWMYRSCKKKRDEGGTILAVFAFFLMVGYSLSSLGR